MSWSATLSREAAFLVRDRALAAWVVLVLVLASISVAGGLLEVTEQRQTIARLLASDREDRQDALAKQSDWGSAAYYSFHLTYSPPQAFAFAALGNRDREPWKHRVRMLALEGQIYERDAGNPALALTGRFDYAFFAAFVLPLVIIVLLHDLIASERSAGRHALLVSTTGKSVELWGARALLRGGAVFAAAAIPLAIGALISGTPFAITAGAVLSLLAYVVFWSAVSLWVASWERPAAVLLAVLFGVWVLLAVVVPAGGRLAIDRLIPVPSGADILLTQREAVNDAWDLPKENTMSAFVERHPEWADFVAMEAPFEWKWYYAFQQVGDQKAEALSAGYRDGRLTRDRFAAGLALLTPPALLERTLQRLANTDLQAQLAYETKVRAFHADLRSYYYPKLFRGEAFDSNALKAMPEYVAGP